MSSYKVDTEAEIRGKILSMRKSMKKLNDNEIYQLVSKNMNYIRIIDYDSADMMQVLARCPRAILRLNEPTESMWSQAIHYDPGLFLICGSKTNNLAAVAAMYSTVPNMHIPHEWRTMTVCTTLVSRNVSWLRFVPRGLRSNGLLSIAIEQSYESAEYIDYEEWTEDLALKYIKRYPGHLRRLPRQYPSVCQCAIDAGHLNIEFVHDQTPELIKLALIGDAANIRLIHHQSKESIEQVMKASPRCIEYVRKQTKEMCIDSYPHFAGSGLEFFNYELFPEPEKEITIDDILRAADKWTDEKKIELFSSLLGKKTAQ